MAGVDHLQTSFVDVDRRPATLQSASKGSVPMLRSGQLKAIAHCLLVMFDACCFAAGSYFIPCCFFFILFFFFFFASLWAVAFAYSGMSLKSKPSMGLQTFVLKPSMESYLFYFPS